MLDALQYMVDRSDRFLALAWEHLLLVAAGVGVAAAIGIPLGVLIARRPRWAGTVLGVSNTLQTVPVLAMIGVVMLFTGLGKDTAVICIAAYSLMPIVRNTYVGITSIDSAVVDAARAMGMTPRQLLLHVQVPLALPAIAAGLRTGALVGMGTASVMSLVAAGGLGAEIFMGLSRISNRIILAGIFALVALTLLLDAVMGLITWLLTSPGIRTTGPRRRSVAASRRRVGIGA